MASKRCAWTLLASFMGYRAYRASCVDAPVHMYNKIKKCPMCGKAILFSGGET